jgi:hypothetical protein
MQAIQITGSGASITTSGSSASVAIPNTASSTSPRYVLVTCTAAAYIRPGDSSVTASTTDIILQPNYTMKLTIAGNTHIAALQVASAGKVNVMPVET